MNIESNLAYLEAYKARISAQKDSVTPWNQFRFVVLDTETTGTDLRRDSLVSIGGVAVLDTNILLDDSFEAVLKISHNTSSVLVHGITREVAARGGDEKEVIVEFIRYLQNSVFVGHHVDFDYGMIAKSLASHYSIPLMNYKLDTMELALRLSDVGALPPEIGLSKNFSLDALASAFHVIPHDRHTASGDAFITAQIFIRLLKAAKRIGWLSLDDLCLPYEIEESI